MKTYKILLYIMISLLVIIVKSCVEDKSSLNFQPLSYFKVKSEINTIVLNNQGQNTDASIADNLIPITVFPEKSAVVVSASEGWCKPELVSVGGKDYVKIVAQTNVGAERLTQVSIMAGLGSDKSGLILYVKQEPALSLDPTDILAKATADSYDLNVKSSGQWTVTSDVEWCSVSQNQGNGDLPLKVNVKLNTSVQARLGTLTFTIGDFSQKLVVSQSGNIPVEDLIDMVYVGGGTFNMGCTPEQLATGNCGSDEYSAHMVTLSDFYISSTMVTQELWKTVMGTIHQTAFVGDKLPVESASWDEVQAFISKLNELTGKKYRLASEAEWEYAARGGRLSKGYIYSGSNTPASVAWYSKTVTQDVAKLAPNELGLYDMSGLLYEWVNDWYEATFSSAPVIDPKGPSTGDRKVLKGGSYRNAVSNVRVSKRAREPRDKKSDNIGFRIAL